MEVTYIETAVTFGLPRMWAQVAEILGYDPCGS